MIVKNCIAGIPLCCYGTPWVRAMAETGETHETMITISGGLNEFYTI